MKSKYVYKQRAYAWVRMLEHQLVVERALGKALPDGIVIHHVDGNGLNNHPTNLVVCPNDAYHSLLHMRTRALDACGNPDWRMCCHCKKWDAPENLAFWKRKSQKGMVIAHRRCAYDAFQKHKARHPEWQFNRNVKQRQRYSSDPSYREMVNARNRENYAKRKLRSRVD